MTGRADHETGFDDGAGGVVTKDTVLRGRVLLFQPKKGFRVSVDPLLLAGFVRKPIGRFVDLGCGVGALSFALLAHDPEASGVAVELQPELAALAQRGVRANGFDARLRVANQDMRHFADNLGAPSFDLVAINPPYRALGHGDLPASRQKQLANHEVSIDIAGWSQVAAKVLRPGGRLAVVFPCARRRDVFATLQMRGFVPEHWCQTIASAGEAPNRLLLELRWPGAALARPVQSTAWDAVQSPDLVVHDGQGFSAEVRAMLGDGVALGGDPPA